MHRTADNSLHQIAASYKEIYPLVLETPIKGIIVRNMGVELYLCPVVAKIARRGQFARANIVAGAISRMIDGELTDTEPGILQ